MTRTVISPPDTRETSVTNLWKPGNETEAIRAFDCSRMKHLTSRGQFLRTLRHRTLHALRAPSVGDSFVRGRMTEESERLPDNPAWDGSSLERHNETGGGGGFRRDRDPPPLARRR